MGHSAVMELKSAEEIEAMAVPGGIIARLFQELAPRIVPGASTGTIDQFAEGFIRDHDGAAPAFKGLYGFPASVCASINEEVVHGIPSEKRVLAEGDILTIDVGVKLDGWFADAAVTFPVGEVDEETTRLLDVTRSALARGIEAARPGRRLGDLGHAIQTVVEEAGYSVVRDLVGHGIGREAHEDPQVPNFGRPGRGLALRKGMVLAIEPMVNQGTALVHTLDDDWTVVTGDGRLSAHFEHTVAIVGDQARILTAG